MHVLVELLLLLLCSCCCSFVSANVVVVSVQWNSIVAHSRTTPTLQVVANPLLDKRFSVSRAMFESLGALEADFVRYVPWFPYPHYGVATLEPPNDKLQKTSWNMTYADPMMADVMRNAKSTIINFSTQPTWMYNTSLWNYPSDPTAVDWTYPRGSALRDPTMGQLSKYYANLLSYLTRGGFTDEYGHKHIGYHYDIPYWEVFNEPEGCHGLNEVEYTKQYDAVTMAMRKVNDKIQFVGLALGGHREWAWYTHFLNSSNHNPSAPMPAMVSFHFYASCSSRTNASTYPEFFPQADAFVEEFKQIRSIRDQLSPDVMLNCDETGVILPDDNDPSAPQFPLVYWNAAAANFAYLYGKLSKEGIDVLGESQLVGAPAIHGLSPQYPSVALLNWTTGAGTARYWVLHTLIRHFGPGDTLVSTTSSASSLVFAQAYIGKEGEKKILIVNKQNEMSSVSLPSAMSACATLTVDYETGFGPPRQGVVGSSPLKLSAFSVVVVWNCK